MCVCVCVCVCVSECLRVFVCALHVYYLVSSEMQLTNATTSEAVISSYESIYREEGKIDQEVTDRDSDHCCQHGPRKITIGGDAASI